MCTLHSVYVHCTQNFMHACINFIHKKGKIFNTFCKDFLKVSYFEYLQAFHHVDEVKLMKFLIYIINSEKKYINNSS